MFEHTLSPESAKRGAPHKSRFFPAALAAHAAALLALLGASLWSVEEPPEPHVPITWVSTSMPPPAPPARGRVAPRPAAGARPERRAVVMPVVIPERLPAEAPISEPAAESAEPVDGAAGPESTGAGPGDGASGIPGGWGPPGGTDPAGTDHGILVPGGDVRAPVLVRRVDPVYPEGARKARLEGDVVLEAIITSRGEIEEVRVIKSAGVLFDTSARSAVEQWSYRPATLNGRAVRVLLTVTITFRLH